MMRGLSAAIGGLVGGAIGAAVWAAIMYFTHYEIGWIAWGIGFLVGVGVRKGAGDWSGMSPGLIAGGLAALAVLGGKYAAASMFVADFVKQAPVQITADDLVESLAWDIVQKRKEQQQPVNWPPGKNEDSAKSLVDFPADIQEQARKQWSDTPQAQQQEQIAQRQQFLDGVRGNMQGMIRDEAFKASFNGYDILWFLLACYTAFQVGSGATASDD